EAATDLRELGRLDEAEAAYQEVLQGKPHHFGALFGLGYVARRRGDRAAAVAWFQAAATADAPNTDARISLASAFRDLAEFEVAEQICLHVLDTFPAYSKANTELGHIARGRGKRAEALAYFKAAVELNESNVSTNLELAAELKEHGRYEEARYIVERVLQAEPANMRAWMQRAYINRHAGNREAARDEFYQISEYYPGLAQPLVDLAIEERALGNNRQAEQLLKRILETQPDHLPALAQLAEGARLCEDFETSLCLYKRAIELHPQNIWLYVHAAQCLDNLGEHIAAFELLDLAISRFGTQWQIVSKRAQLLKRAGRNHEARALVEDAHKNNPHNFEIWSACVRFDLLFGDLAAAAQKLQNFSTDLVLQNSQLHVLLGQLAEAQFNFEGAMHHYGISTKLHPQNRSAQADMFRVCLLSLRTEEARSHLEQWTRLGTMPVNAQGRTTNLSQSAMGQIYDEFVLDKASLEQLTDIQKLPPKDRIAPLRSMLASNPDYTPAAIQLIVALRQTNSFCITQFVTSDKTARIIPRAIIQYWDSPEPPSDIRLLMQTWRDKNRDCQYQLFDDKTAKEFLAEHYSTDVLRAYKRATHPAEKADLFRLAYLYANGGIYVDADDRCVGPLGEVLPFHAELIVYQEDYALGGLAVGTLGNNFLAAAPKNAVIGRALELATQALNMGDTDVVWLKTGPGLITRAFAQTAANTLLKPSAWLKGVVILERAQLSHASAFHCFATYKQAQHWSKQQYDNTGSPKTSQ
ncbi:tetratricopeptide repeat protein, partial [Microvirga sp. BT689]|uniref:tetratricopeptide repeat protein n=1 Tax=Microvirga arvi TaxID=2778731 RepID=UPI0019508374